MTMEKTKSHNPICKWCNEEIMEIYKPLELWDGGIWYFHPTCYEIYCQLKAASEG